MAVNIIIIADDEKIFDWASKAFPGFERRYKKRSTFAAAKAYADQGDMLVGDFSPDHKVKLQESGYTVILPPPDIC